MEKAERLISDQESISQTNQHQSHFGADVLSIISEPTSASAIIRRRDELAQSINFGESLRTSSRVGGGRNCWLVGEYINETHFGGSAKKNQSSKVSSEYEQPRFSFSRVGFDHKRVLFHICLHTDTHLLLLRFSSCLRCLLRASSSKIIAK